MCHCYWVGGRSKLFLFSWHRSSYKHITWSRLTVQAAWMTGACLVCLGPWEFLPPNPHMIPEKWRPGTWKMAVFGRRTGKTVRKMHPPNLLGVPWIVFKGANSRYFMLFSHRAVVGCYGNERLNLLPWNPLNSIESPGYVKRKTRFPKKWSYHHP